MECEEARAHVGVVTSHFKSGHFSNGIVRDGLWPEGQRPRSGRDVFDPAERMVRDAAQHIAQLRSGSEAAKKAAY